jgi:hypothetical protein
VLYVARSTLRRAGIARRQITQLFSAPGAVALIATVV